MSKVDASVISGETNQAVIQLSNRLHPSLCIQGDTLIALASVAYSNAQIWIKNEGNPLFPDELLDGVVQMSNRLVSLVISYNDAVSRIDNERLLQVNDMRIIDF